MSLSVSISLSCSLLLSLSLSLLGAIQGLCVRASAARGAQCPEQNEIDDDVDENNDRQTNNNETLIKTDINFYGGTDKPDATSHEHLDSQSLGLNDQADADEVAEAWGSCEASPGGGTRRDADDDASDDDNDDDDEATSKQAKKAKPHS